MTDTRPPIPMNTAHGEHLIEWTPDDPPGRITRARAWVHGHAPQLLLLGALTAAVVVAGVVALEVIL